MKRERATGKRLKEYDIQNSRKNQNQNKTLFTHEMAHEKN
jgi:hypothetical protein